MDDAVSILDNLAGTAMLVFFFFRIYFESFRILRNRNKISVLATGKAKCYDELTKHSTREATQGV